VKPIALPLTFLGLTNSINKATITAIAVPVRNSSRNQLAFCSTPLSASQFATNKMFPARNTNPINPKK